MEYVVYVLKSSVTEKTYTGQTSNLIARYKSHNSLSKKGWTVRFRPWTVVFIKFFTTRKEAISFEKYLKSGKGRDWLTPHDYRDSSEG